MYKLILTLVSLVSLSFSLISRAQISILIEDQSGNPVENAVVSVKSTQPSVMTTEVAIMDQVNKLFLPRVLVIKRGQSVLFPNSDNIRHHVYSFSKPKNFEIKLYSGLQTAPIAFENAGVVVLGCNIHDNMIGFVYVSNVQENESEITGITGKNGMVSLNTEKIKTASVWHENLSSGITSPVFIELSATEPDSHLIGKIQLNEAKQPSQKKTLQKAF